MRLAAVGAGQVKRRSKTTFARMTRSILRRQTTQASCFTSLCTNSVQGRGSIRNAPKITAFAVVFLTSCTANLRQEPAADVRVPMEWPANPVLSCDARIEYARQFIEFQREGLPEERITVADISGLRQERDEILEIRRRVYHDREALKEVLACSGDSDT